MRPRAPLLHAAMSLALTLGCGGSGCPSGYVCTEREAGVDGGLDGSTDAGACGGRCSGATPVCLDDACVACGTDEDCTGSERCEPASHACVACLTNDDCTSAGASACSATYACEGCAGDDGCTHLTASPVCDEPTSTCVACTVDTEAARCGGNSCEPSLHTCTTTPTGSLGLCAPCAADSECMTGQACVPTDFAATSTGTRCLPVRAGPGCARPFFDARDDVTSASGAAANVCDLRTTSCDAFLDFSNARGTCTGSSAPASAHDAECGTSGAADGLCRLSGGGNRCTYECGGDDDCPLPAGTFTCLTTTPRYCSL